MTPGVITELGRQALMTTLWLAMPILIVAAAVSLLISIGQTLTSISDSTLSTVPKLAAVGAAAFLLLPWFMRKLVSYTTLLFHDFHRYIG